MAPEPWEIRATDAGMLVKLLHADLDIDLAAALVEKIGALALESGRAIVYLDFGPVHFLPSVVIGKLFTLMRQLQALHGHLYLCNLAPSLAEVLQIVGWPASSIAAPPSPESRP